MVRVPDYLIRLHPVVIHFPITGFVLATIFAYLALFSRLTKKMNKELLTNVSLLNFWMGAVFYPIAAITGMVDALSFERAISIDLLALKIVAGMFTIFVLISMFSVLGKDLMSGDKLVNKTSQFNSYFIFVNILLVLITLTATWGGIYVFGHSIFDLFGIRYLIPQKIHQPINNLFQTDYEAIFYSPVMTALLLIVFTLIILLLKKLHRKSDKNPTILDNEA